MTRLSSKQRGIVNASPDNLIVQAIPGSGKTETLLACAERLVEEGLAQPEHLQFITFERPASRDLQRRLKRVNALRDCKANTLHSLCRSLNDDIEIEENKPGATSQTKLTERLLNQLTIPAALADTLRLKEGEYRSIPEGGRQTAFHQLAVHLTPDAPDRPVTYTELLLWTLKRLKASTDSTHLRDTDWTSLIIDEAQDLTHLQWTVVLELLRKITAPGGPHLIAVGDVNQRLYDFQGAEPDFTDFLLRSGITFTRLTLDETWRCRGEIALLASSYLKKVDRKPHVLIPARGFGGQVSHPLRAPTPAALAETLLDVQAAAQAKGHDLAVLTSTNRMIATILRLLPGSVPIRRTRDPANPAELHLTAALRCAFGLSSPGGGHPLLQEGTFFDNGLTRQERRETHTAWETGKPSPSARVSAQEQLFRTLSTGTSQEFVKAAVDNPATALLDLAERYPAPERLLAALHARRQQYASQPRTHVGTVHSAKGQEWPEVALIFDTGDGEWSREMTYVGLTRPRESIHLIAFGHGALPAVLAEAQETETEREAVRAALLGKMLPSRSTMLTYLRHATLGPYLRHHWPRHTDRVTLRNWQAELQEHAPSEWQRLPAAGSSGSWRERVTILEDHIASQECPLSVHGAEGATPAEQ